MGKFRVQWSDEIKVRTIEKPSGPYLVCLEGYFDFNEALVKLMLANGDFLPKAAQYEPFSDEDSDEDFNEPQFDDVCDALQASNELSDRFNRPVPFVKGDDDSQSSKSKSELDSEKEEKE